VRFGVNIDYFRGGPVNLSYAALQQLVRRVAAGHYPDLEDFEVESATSSLLTTFGLQALNLALDYGRLGRSARVEGFESREGFDFSTLSRVTIVNQLDAASGLGIPVCQEIVTEIETWVAHELDKSGEVTIEHLGTFSAEFGSGLILTLDAALRVVPPDEAVAVHAFS
jgi:hypothetical protein